MLNGGCGGCRDATMGLKWKKIFFCGESSGVELPVKKRILRHHALRDSLPVKNYISICTKNNLRL